MTAMRRAGEVSLDGERLLRLPRQLTSFIGRVREVERLKALLAEVPLLTLTGPGGVGKTRLAIQVAGEVAGQYEHEVRWVPLAAVTAPEQVVSAIAEALGIGEVRNQTLLEAIGEALLDRELLLLLDNFEHVLSAASDVAYLLAAAPRLKVLVTSRTALHLYGEQEFPVPPMEAPAADDGATIAHRPSSFVRNLESYEAVALFVGRAKAVRPDFALTEGNANDVVEICRRLDCLPLAIELAAARSKVLSPQALLARLDDRLGLLTGGASNMPARQQMLRSTIDWSYDLLDDAEKQLFRELSVFVGGCTLEAVEAVGGGESRDFLELVSSLANKSLVKVDVEPEEEYRITMLETIREYAGDRLAHDSGGGNGEVERLRERHARYYLSLAEASQMHMGGAGQGLWLRRLEAEHGNLQTALSWAAWQGEQGGIGGAALAVQLASALGQFWLVRGHFSEGRGHLERAVTLVPLLMQAQDGERSQLAGIEGIAAAIQRGLGGLTRALGDFAASRGYYEHALALYKELGDRSSQARILGDLGVLAHSEGDNEEARVFMTEALALARETDNQTTIASASHNLGNLARDRGDRAEARALYEQVLALVTKTGDINRMGVSLNNLANLAFEDGDYRRARDLHRRALELRRQVGNKLRIAESLIGMAAVEIADGALERGARLLGSAESLLDATGGKIDPMERKLYDRSLAALGAAEDAAMLDKVRQEGREMGTDLEKSASWRRPDVERAEWRGYGRAEGSSPLARRQKSEGRKEPRPAGLTRRELDVLRLVATGLTDAQVAERLFLSSQTVHSHLRSVYSKLDVANRLEATRYAIEHKLL
jgi:predicted ATPase/DNA-binding CsgD family transcriptional regulator